MKDVIAQGELFGALPVLPGGLEYRLEFITAEEEQALLEEFRKLPLVVLVNGASASCAEVIAAALQDHGRAKVIGQRTQGVGTLQSLVALADGSALRLTTARYYTPSGRSIQAKGIDPDILLLEDVPDDIKGKDETKDEASLPGHLKNGDDEKSGSQAYVPTDPKKDKQLGDALYMAAPAPDGSVWGTVLGFPGAIVRVVPGDNATETALAERYEVPWNDPKAPINGDRKSTRLNSSH